MDEQKLVNCEHKDVECKLGGQGQNLIPAEQPDTFIIESTYMWYDMECPDCGFRWTEFTEPEPYNA